MVFDIDAMPRNTYTILLRVNLCFCVCVFFESSMEAIFLRQLNSILYMIWFVSH